MGDYPHLTQTAEDIQRHRDLIRWDWLVTRAWNVLHFAELSDEQVAEMEYEMILTGPIRLSCGRTAASVTVPGWFTRMGAQRCTGCCRALGYPTGKGSPKNDPVCRALLGLKEAS